MDKTFTREQFDEAVKKASDKFTDLATEKQDGAKDIVAVFVMGLQNMTFASLIGEFLFGEEPSKECE